jgi:hypothetical protein
MTGVKGHVKVERADGGVCCKLFLGLNPAHILLAAFEFQHETANPTLASYSF